MIIISSIFLEQVCYNDVYCKQIHINFLLVFILYTFDKALAFHSLVNDFDLERCECYEVISEVLCGIHKHTQHPK